jgi:hypothetical protein
MACITSKVVMFTPSPARKGVMQRKDPKPNRHIQPNTQQPAQLAIQSKMAEGKRACRRLCGHGQPLS